MLEDILKIKKDFTDKMPALEKKTNEKAVIFFNRIFEAVELKDLDVTYYIDALKDFLYTESSILYMNLEFKTNDSFKDNITTILRTLKSIFPGYVNYPSILDKDNFTEPIPNAVELELAGLSSAAREFVRMPNNTPLQPDYTIYISSFHNFQSRIDEINSFTDDALKLWLKLQ